MSQSYDELSEDVKSAIELLEDFDAIYGDRLELLTNNEFRTGQPAEMLERVRQILKGT